MIRLFKSTDFTATAILAATVIILRGGWYFIDATMPASNGGIGYTWVQPFLSNHTTAIIVGIILINIQIFFLIQFFNRNKFSRLNTSVAGLFYALLTSFAPEFQYCPAIIISATFIIPAFDILFATHRQKMPSGQLWNVGLLIGLASLFYPPAAILTVGAFLAVISIRAFKVQELLIVLSGTVLPFFLAFVGYFWFDQLPYFITEQFGGLSTWFDFNYWVQLPNIITTGLFLLLIVFVILRTPKLYAQTSARTRVNLGATFLLLGFSLAASIWPNGWHFQHFFLLCFPIAVFLTQDSITQKNSNIGNMLVFCLILVLAFNHTRQFLFT